MNKVSTKPVIRRTANGFLRNLTEKDRQFAAALFDPKDPVTHRNRNTPNAAQIVKVIRLAFNIGITKSCAIDLQSHFKTYWSEVEAKRKTST